MCVCMCVSVCVCLCACVRACVGVKTERDWTPVPLHYHYVQQAVVDDGLCYGHGTAGFAQLRADTLISLMSRCHGTHHGSGRITFPGGWPVGA